MLGFVGFRFEALGSEEGLELGFRRIVLLAAPALAALALLRGFFAGGDAFRGLDSMALDLDDEGGLFLLVEMDRDLVGADVLDGMAGDLDLLALDLDALLEK